jgi:Ca-activated chloride channel family protein
MPTRLSLLALSLLLAGPPGAAQTSERSPCADDIMLVFDASQSMAAADDSKEGLRRIDSVRAALARILPRVAPRRRLGLLSYGPGDLPVCANVMLQLLPQSNAGKRISDIVGALTPGGQTPLAAAVRQAAEALGHRERPATIVVLTDGEDTCQGNPCALAEALKAESPGLIVHVVSYRIADSLGSDRTFRSRCLADTTGGLYVSANTADELAEALEKVLACPYVSDNGDRLRIRLGASGR